MNPPPSAVTLPAITIDDVTVELEGRTILAGVTVESTARTVAVLGANGSGKSTFARLLNGLVMPASGTVTVHGSDTRKNLADVRRRVGFVFSSPDAQILMPTVQEDLALSLKGRGMSRAEITERVRETMEQYGLTELAQTAAFSLSGGQKQLLALASVLITAPSLIVADEPTTLLDLDNTRRVSDLLINGIDAQRVIVTHDLRLAVRCEQALLFEGGRLIDVGEPSRVVTAYRQMYA